MQNDNLVFTFLPKIIFHETFNGRRVVFRNVTNKSIFDLFKLERSFSVYFYLPNIKIITLLFSEFYNFKDIIF